MEINKPFKIIVTSNNKKSVTMVDIDGEEIFYGNIREMYTQGNGAGIQTNLNEQDNKQARYICDNISNLIYKLSDLLIKENQC